MLDGALDGDGRTHDIGPGIVLAAAVAKQWERGAWFVTGSLGAAAARVTTREAGGDRTALVAVDVLRVGVQAGRAFGPARPYVLARAFGGPVWWRLDGADRTGTDIHHYQLGVGGSVTTRAGLSLSIDLAALGERSATLGASLAL